LVNKNPLVQAKTLAYRALASQAYSRRELEKKLQRHGFQEEIVTSVLNELETHHYLDDRAFALAWAKKTIAQRFVGPSALQRGLESKGIDRDIIQEVLEKLYGGAAEEHVALKAMRRRLAQVKAGKSKAFERGMVGYLTRRGFTSEIIEKVVKRQSESLA
jgi:regulatory protein